MEIYYLMSIEFGTLDPLEDIIGLKEKFRKLV
jgi:hypothetical protein